MNKTVEESVKQIKDYVRGWGGCDDFCTHAFGELLNHVNIFAAY